MKKTAGKSSRGLALFALLAACSSDPSAPRDRECDEGDSNCGDCVAESTDCSPIAEQDASRSRARDAASVSDGRAARDEDEDDDEQDERDAGQRVDAARSADASLVDASTRDARIAQGEDASVDAATRSDAGKPNENPAKGFVAAHGALRVQGNRVVDQQGQAIQLRGMSWFWSQWTDFYVAKNVDVVADEWKGTVVRAALGVENEGGYLEAQQPNVDKVRVLVDRAIERGVYVIIDWHDHNAQDHMAQATTFFRQMAEAYGKSPNVIFEIYNEPLSIPWGTVKGYAEQIIRTIRGAGSQNLIIVGTPTWSQDVDVAAQDPIKSDNNVAYTLHFYADTHKQALRDKAQKALDRGIALFVTEWGTCSADGNGNVNPNETQTWLRFLRERSISWANWALNNKAEACSAIQASGASVGPWRDDQLTESGKLVKAAIP